MSKEFNLKKFILNNPLLEELPKNKWIDLDKKETEEYKEDIFDLIQKAYSSIGGHLNYKTPDDVTGSEGESDYEVADVDEDPEIDVVSFSGKTPFGIKLKGMGHDGTKQAKRSVIKHHIDNLNSGGYYVEVSGRIKDILLDAGVPVITDKEKIEKILQGKNIEMNDDGSYQRVIGGEKHTKIMLGKV